MIRLLSSSYSANVFCCRANRTARLQFSSTARSLVEKKSCQYDLSHKYASTIQLPQSRFSSRSDSKLIESKLKPQSTSNLYSWNASRPLKDNNLDNLFILHDGPPYANSDLHVGHALNKILKDIITRFELLKGKKVHYKPGWDCHGLPIELKTLEKLQKAQKEEEKILKKQLKKLSKESKEYESINEKLNILKYTKLSPIEIVKLSKEHALNAKESQSRQFQNLGIMGDFDNPYLTLQKDFVTDQLKIFKKLFDNDLIKRQEKPVYWGCENSTALAEGELEYNHEHKSTAAYIKFPIKHLPSKLKSTGIGKFDNISALIWTSTPWTLASNKAISINENLIYTILSSQQHGNLIVASDLASSIKELDPSLEETGIELQGSELIGWKYTNPLFGEDSTEEFPIFHGDHVTNSAGTGLVHTAPGHGQDDYLVCLKNGILPYSPVDNFGKYTRDLPEALQVEFTGLKVLGEGTKKMLEKLDSLKMCLKVDPNYCHSYPYDWRSKKPIIIRATPQWFIDVSKIKKITTEKLENEVEFHPPKGSKRLISFVNTRNEWCISRQRSWGVPIPVVYHKETGEALLNDEVIDRIINIIEKEDVESWVIPNDDMSKWVNLPNANDYVKGTDTMDVWFDSGSSWKLIENYLSQEGLLKAAETRGYLADVYLEGSDQHRGWFQSSILTKMGVTEFNKNEKAVLPYKKIITHGFTLDSKGDKMSKSLGNSISPSDILVGNKQMNIPALGIDGLRLWVAGADYSSDVAIGPTILKHVADNLKKIRFTFKFILGVLSDFNPESNSVPYEELDNFDKFILSKLHTLHLSTIKNYENFNYAKIMREFNHFMNVDLSSIYFDIRKDCLYTDHPTKSLKRLATQTTFVEILNSLTILLSPILPIITQEVWNNTHSAITKGLESPFMIPDALSQLPDHFYNEQVENEFNTLLGIRDSVKYAIDRATRLDKNVKNPLETRVYINAKEDSTRLTQLLSKYEKDLGDYFMVSQVKLNQAVAIEEGGYSYVSNVEVDNLGDCTVTVVKSDKCKCPRCWKFTRDESQEICNRCFEVVNDL